MSTDVDTTWKSLHGPPQSYFRRGLWGWDGALQAEREGDLLPFPGWETGAAQMWAQEKHLTFLTASL